MGRIQVLDCTLRDGGYCNEWKFGATNVRHIISGLEEAGIDIIECGFLTHKVEYENGVTKFSSMSQIMPFITQPRKANKFVFLVNFGELDIEKLETRSAETVDGIRVAFHKKDRVDAIKLCEQIKAKGYDVFVQPMVSLSYTDEEFLSLIKEANKFSPYAFYIVDSFGVMKQSDLMRLYHLVENNLSKKIKIGYHSHNNLQLAYSNAQSLVNLQTNRELILDSSIMGMGRGAGNLNTELFLEYLNDTKEINYQLKPILCLIDEVISGFHQENYWGYSLPNYLSAKHNVHPNYAKYLSDKNTLTITEMNEIFDKIEGDKRVNFDKKYIESLYFNFMRKGVENQEHIEDWKNSIKGKKILLIAPGKSSVNQKDKIVEFMKNSDVVSISINNVYEPKYTDYVFISNIRRFNALGKKADRVIATSNIPDTACFLTVKYEDLLNDQERVSDNAGLMIIKLLINLDVDEIYLAGYDGYSYVNEANYAEKDMQINYKKMDIDELNDGMHKILGEYSKKIRINFLTEQKFIRI